MSADWAGRAIRNQTLITPFLTSCHGILPHHLQAYRVCSQSLLQPNLQTSPYRFGMKGENWITLYMSSTNRLLTAAGVIEGAQKQNYDADA